MKKTLVIVARRANNHISTFMDKFRKNCVWCLTPRVGLKFFNLVIWNAVVSLINFLTLAKKG